MSAAHPLETVQKTTVLLVEPDVIVRLAVADYLRDCGYRVIEAGTGDDALMMLEAGHKIDVILCEVRLPGSIDGFGLARQVRRQYPGVDVILTSGIPGAAARAGDLCDEGPLDKPYHPSEVVRRINILIERRRSAGDISASRAADRKSALAPGTL
jgi:CheY-like chemotaxis protein